MWIRKLVAAALGTVVLAGGVGPLGAEAVSPTGSKITVRISDPTPSTGQTFVLRGRYTRAGHDAAGHMVKVQTYRNGDWSMIPGARVRTGVDGHYRVRLVLQIRGVRDLRVVGVAGGNRANSYHRFVVEVR